MGWTEKKKKKNNWYIHYPGKIISCAAGLFFLSSDSPNKKTPSFYLLLCAARPWINFTLIISANISLIMKASAVNVVISSLYINVNKHK